jgi:hypoxia-inducible factor (prolyl hydroxylase)
MGRAKKKEGGAGLAAGDVGSIERQLAELRLQQEMALQGVLRAQKEMAEKQAETERTRRDLEATEAAKQKASAEADFAAKTISGDDYADALADGLQRDGFAFVDHFLGEPVASYIRDEMQIMRRDGLLKESELAGGKSGNNMRYSMASIRGDVVRFVDGTEDEGCYNIGLLKEFSDQVVVRVQERVSELQQQVIQRGKLMCTCYPGDSNQDLGCGHGGPCRYVRHCDNPDKNGRVLTALYYLNKAWTPHNGGCLRIYPSDSEGNSRSEAVDIQPLHDRFLLFYSDKRCPHEVLPALAPRYAITTWYYNADERRNAVDTASEEQSIETSRIMQEIEKFKAQTGSDVSRVSQPDIGSWRGGSGAVGTDSIAQISDTSIPGVLSPQVIAQGGHVDLEELD